MKLLKYNIEPGGRYFTLIPFGCVHFESEHHRRDLFDGFLAEMNALKTWCIGLGDYQDFLRTTDRHALRAAAINEDYHRDIDRLINRQVREMAQYIKRKCPKFGDKCIGLVEGNHFWTYRNGETTTQHLCDLLGVSYLQEKAWIRLAVRTSAAGNNTGATGLRILAHHGYNLSGGSPALSLRRLEMRVAPAFDADLILSSHAHQLGVSKFVVESITDRYDVQLVQKTRILAKTGCFYDGNCPTGSGSYATKALLPPTALGFIRFRVRIARSGVGVNRGFRGLEITHEY